MSGTNHTVLSEVMLKNNSESALTKALDNANEFAKGLDIKGGKKAK